MHSTDQPTQAQATEALGDPKSFQLEDNRSRKIFRSYTLRCDLRRFVWWHWRSGVLDTFVARI